MKETKKFNLKNYDEFDAFIKEKELFGWEYVNQKEMITYGTVEYYKGGLISTDYNVNTSENHRLEANGKAYLEVTMQREKNSSWYEETCQYEKEYEMLNKWFSKKDIVMKEICQHFSISNDIPSKPVFTQTVPEKKKKKYIIFTFLSLLLIETGPICLFLFGYCLYKAITTPGGKKYEKLLEEYNTSKKEYEEELKKYNSFESIVNNKVHERLSYIRSYMTELVK